VRSSVVARHSDRAGGGVTDVRDGAVEPSPVPVTEQPVSPGPPGPDRPLADDPTIPPTAVRDRRRLEDEADVGHAHMGGDVDVRPQVMGGVAGSAPSLPLVSAMRARVPATPPFRRRRSPTLIGRQRPQLTTSCCTAHKAAAARVETPIFA